MSETVLASCEQDLEKIKSLYTREKLFQAADETEKLLFKLEQHKQDESIAELWKSHESLLETIKRENTEANTLLHELQSEEGWELCANKDNIQTFYRKEAHEKLHTLKIQGTIDSPMFNVLSIFYEIDLYKTWLPRCPTSKTLKQYGRYRFLSYYEFEMPWPLYNRDLLSYGYGVDLMDESNSILVVIHSVPEDDHDKHPGVEFPPANTSTCARMDLKFSGIHIRPITQNQTYVSLIASCDPQFSYIPGWFMNMVQHQLSYLVMHKLRDVAANIPGSEYEKRIEENVTVYGDIRERLEKHFQKSEVDTSHAQILL